MYLCPIINQNPRVHVFAAFECVYVPWCAPIPLLMHAHIFIYVCSVFAFHSVPKFLCVCVYLYVSVSVFMYERVAAFPGVCHSLCAYVQMHMSSMQV